VLYCYHVGICEVVHTDLCEENLMSSVPKYLPNYTVADYQLWQGDWQLIDGVAIAMSPSPFGPHERIISRLSFEIQSATRSGKCPCEVYTALDWIMNENTVVRPDLMVVCGQQPERHLERPPVLVVEVLSESTRRMDLIAKREHYREQKVPHYLIIDPIDLSIEHITAEGSSRHAADETIEFSLKPDCPVSIECSRLFD